MTFVVSLNKYNIMRHIYIVIILVLVSFSGSYAQESENEFQSFGEEIKADESMQMAEISALYSQMKIKDTLQAKFTATVTGVCQAKGCWMSLALEDGSEAMVRFKDYGFFVPMDIVGQEVVVNGNAFVEEMSVADQQHYAKDAGLSEDDIAKITDVKRTFSFEADGVLLRL